ncbi:MAG: ribosomal protein S18-alanine N-acetyltransferase [Syntrophobacteraceae bacterium]
MEITVAAPAESDLPTILAIELDSQPEPWTEKSFREELGRKSLFVARIRGKIAGYICFWCVSDEVQILNVAVREDFRRKGIARKLIEFALGSCRQATLATLEVRKSNRAARGLYESLGFRVTGERPGYYATHGESAILMERAVSSAE